MQELMLFKQLMGQDNWLHVVFLAGILIILVFRRESIAIPAMFKLSILLFAMALVVPAIMTPFVNALGGMSVASPYGRSSMPAGDISFVVTLVYNAVGPCAGSA